MLTIAGQALQPGFLSSLSPPQGSAHFEASPSPALIQGRCPCRPHAGPRPTSEPQPPAAGSTPVAHVQPTFSGGWDQGDAEMTERAGGALHRQHQKRSGRHRAIRSGEGRPRKLRIKPLPWSPFWVHLRGGRPLTVGRSPLRDRVWASELGQTVPALGRSPARPLSVRKPGDQDWP